MSFGPNSYVERLAGLLYHGLCGAGALGLLLLVGTALFGAPRDATDPPAGSLSGLILYTDHGTGCQYVGKSGALTPRMQADGKQAGCRS